MYFTQEFVEMDQFCSYTSSSELPEPGQKSGAGKKKIRIRISNTGLSRRPREYNLMSQ
jgi:hypothetical protein